MGTLVAFVLVSIAVPALRKRHPELKGTFTLPFGPYVIPMLSAVTALWLDLLPQGRQPARLGLLPDRLAGVLDWFIAGLIFYFSYGRHKSTVALEQTEGLAVRNRRLTEVTVWDVPIPAQPCA